MEPIFMILDSGDHEAYFAGTKDQCKGWLFNWYIIPDHGEFTILQLEESHDPREEFQLPDHLQDQRADWIIAERKRNF